MVVGAWSGWVVVQVPGVSIKVSMLFKMYHPKSELGVPRTKLELAHGAILQS